MLQRKQSIYLLLATLLSLATWLFPIAKYEMGSGVHEFRTTGLFDPDGTEDPAREPVIPFAMLYMVTAGIFAVSILLYGNRPRQARVVRLTYLLTLAMLAFQYIVSNSVLAYLAQQGTVDRSYGVTFFVPLVVLVLSFLAERAIRSDEALVRSMDRLR